MTSRILVLLLVLVLVPIVIASIRSYITSHSPYQEVFLSGFLPSKALSGRYKGTILTSLGTTTWVGKEISAKDKGGINIFQTATGTIKRYPFRLLEVSSVENSKKKIVRLDYGLPENPFWMRFVHDEMVETKPGIFLGKMFISVVRPLSFGVGFFQLESGK